MDDWAEGNEGEKIVVPIHISKEMQQNATETWIAADDTSSLRDHLLDRVEIAPLFLVDGEPIE